MDNGESSYRRFLAGDDDGMTALIRDYKDGLQLYLNSFTHNLHLAEDCVQDTFVKLAIKKPKFQGRSTFKTWLYAIGRNVAIDALRRARQHIPLDECAELADRTDIEQNYLKEEQKIQLHRAIRELKSDYQQVLYLTYFENFSNDETAQIMHKTRRQIQNLLHNARKSLKSELEKEGFRYEEL